MGNLTELRSKKLAARQKWFDDNLAKNSGAKTVMVGTYAYHRPGSQK